MKAALGPFRFLFKLYFGIVFFIVLFILSPFMLLCMIYKPGRVKSIFTIRVVWSYLMQLFTFIWVVKKKQGKVPDGPVVICSNHQSYLDIVMMYSILPKTFRFLGKMELVKWPVFGYFFKAVDIPVDRASRMASVRSINVAGDAVDQGHSIAIFPEATIPLDTPKLKNFKNGAFSLAIKKQVPIVPITILNHYIRFSDPGDYFGKASPGLSRVVIHEAIETKGMTEEDLVPLRKRVYEIIDNTLKEYENR